VRRVIKGVNYFSAGMREWGLRRSDGESGGSRQGQPVAIRSATDAGRDRRTAQRNTGGQVQRISISTWAGSGAGPEDRNPEHGVIEGSDQAHLSAHGNGATMAAHRPLSSAVLQRLGEFIDLFLKIYDLIKYLNPLFRLLPI